MNLINPFANLLGAIQNPPSDPNQFSLNIGNAVNSLFGNLGNNNANNTVNTNTGGLFGGISNNALTSCNIQGKYLKSNDYLLNQQLQLNRTPHYSEVPLMSLLSI